VGPGQVRYVNPTRVRVSSRVRPRVQRLREWAGPALVRATARSRVVLRTLGRRTPPLASALLGLLAVGSIVAGIAMIFVPAGFIAGGLALLGILTFNPATVRKITWPR
jgi:hypothetical protein